MGEWEEIMTLEKKERDGQERRGRGREREQLVMEKQK